jgi:hypothetical protein
MLPALQIFLSCISKQTLKERGGKEGFRDKTKWAGDAAMGNDHFVLFLSSTSAMFFVF